MTENNIFKIEDIQEEAIKNRLNALLHDENVAFLFNLFPNDSLRIVAGILRDCFLDHPQNDIDFATTLLPEQIVQLAKKAGLKTKHHGIDHGTVMVIYNHIGYEITTLREDVKTDGRHAEVVFTTDWEKDAHRRDFTINALSMDQHGQLYDYVGSIKDIKEKRLDFIGDASARVQEDYLRILRLYRFMSQTGFTPSFKARQAAKEGKTGLEQISKERIGTEILKLFGGKNYIQTLKTIEQDEVWQEVVPIYSFIELLEPFEALSPKNISDRFARIYVSLIHETEDIQVIKSSLKLSNKQTKLLQTYQAAEENALVYYDETLDYIWEVHAYYFDVNVANFLVTLLVAQQYLDGGLERSDIPALKKEIENTTNKSKDWVKPIFPIKAKDLLEKGVKREDLNLALGLKELEWVENGFKIVEDEE